MEQNINFILFLPASYVYGLNTDCPTGTTKLVHEAECKLAATDRGGKYAGVENKIRPFGCYFWTIQNKFYWNPNSSRNGNSYVTTIFPVCKPGTL